jgi:histidyl-tRNA synthetase
MDYYTGPIFEIAAAGVPFSLAGGGRFDDLVERLAGVRVPACGFSIGFERVYTLMEERGMFGDGARAADVLVAVPATEATADALRLAAELRAGELRVDGFPHAGKLGPQFELAERKGIPFAVVADPEKLRAGTLEVRQLASRQSAMVARTELIAWLRTRLVSPRG